MTAQSKKIQSEKGKLNKARLSISSESLIRRCDPSTLQFTTTDELPALHNVIGQPRALRALDLGIDVTGIGYNIFVLGIPDSGRTTLTRNYLLQKAQSGKTPDDWCYVNNFENPHQPNALSLPAGKGASFRDDMKGLIALCAQNIPRAFESEEYSKEHERLRFKLNEEMEKELHQFEAYAAKFNFMVVKTPYGFLLVPTAEGKPLSSSDFEKLSDENKEKLVKIQESLSERLDEMIERLHSLERTTSHDLHELDRRTSLFVIQPLIDELRAKYTPDESVIHYLDQVQDDLANNGSRFRMKDQSAQNPPQIMDWLTRYEVNLLVNNAGQKGAPVIIENQPTYQSLLGTIEHEIFMGISHSDFTHIRPGALHRANGGYIILPARAVMLGPYVWEGLKRVLRDKEIRIVELGNQIGLLSTASLEPEPIPLNVKVIMVGTPLMYYMLRAYDEDFAKLFKVCAEFSREMTRDSESEQDYALFVRSVVLENKLLPFDRTAVARVIEHGSRMVENQDKLSTQFGIISDLVCESDYWARKEKQTIVNAAAVQRAIDERTFRSNLLHEKIKEMIHQKQLLVSVSGRVVGQINALSVSSLGDYTFGRPNRVTATTCAGKAGVVDIERQANLGGSLHTKGVLIINGYLGQRYGQDVQISLSASLTFEQSYDEIEGDSASAAELIALLSAVSEIPIDQGIAITGSVNQYGQIQAIGGVNEKIEGFYDICEQEGLNGKQGVIIPRANQKNLMLREDICSAVKSGKFHLWGVESIAEAVELLTGVAMAERNPDGSFPKGSFDVAVVSHLSAYDRIVNPAQGKRVRKKKEISARGQG